MMSKEMGGGGREVQHQSGEGREGTESIVTSPESISRKKESGRGVGGKKTKEKKKE
jgi:hypothetical protein